MSETTAIEWCDSTFNPWIGCTRVGPGCDNCYAAVSTPARTMRITWGPNRQRHLTSPANWAEPIKWQRQHEEFRAQHGRRRRVFCASLADVFDNEVPAQWRIELLRLIDSTRHLDWLLLTKRIGNAAAMLETAMRAHTAGREGWTDNYLPNVWIGATVVEQAEADRDVPKLLATPAAVRFLSIEPMLGPVELDDWLKVRKHWKSADSLAAAPWNPPYPKHRYKPQALVLAGWMPPLHWVICGGESGPGARPMHPDWARSLRDQCAAAGVPFMFKQHGEWREPLAGEPYNTTMGRAQRVPAFIVAKSGTVRCFENDEMRDGGKAMLRVGKKSAGRLLDGVEHNGFPEVA